MVFQYQMNIPLAPADFVVTGTEAPLPSGCNAAIMIEKAVQKASGGAWNRLADTWPASRDVSGCTCDRRYADAG